MMKGWFSFSVLLVGAVCSVGLSACGEADNNGFNAPGSGEGVVSLTPVKLSAAQTAAFTASNNDFAFNFLREIRREEAGGKNLLLSPVSVTFALGMTASGASEKVATEIADALGFRGSRDELNAFCQYLLQRAGQIDPQVRLGFANAAFFRNECQVQPLFSQALSQYYQAETGRLDFTQDEAFDFINSWASEKTEGCIEEINKRPYQKEAVIELMLLNALYFKAGWTDPFNPEKTTEGSFKKSDGTVVQLPMMVHTGPTLSADFDKYSALRMYYGNKKFSMTILLPAASSSVGELIDNLTAGTWAETVGAIDQLEAKYGPGVSTSSIVKQKQIPRFMTKCHYDLKEAMAAMNAPSMFLQGGLPYMTDKSYLFVSDIFHDTYIDVNEQGTEAAAVTEVVVSWRGGAPRFVADRPFVYVISDAETHGIYFVGVYEGDAGE